MILYLVPARGGSKRLPNKNLRKFDGQPLPVRAMFKAQYASELVGGDSRVIVSTDSEEIASEVQRFSDHGRFLVGEVLMRPAELATDECAVEKAAIHAADAYKADTVVLIQPTSPLIMPDLIAGMVRAYVNDLVPRMLCAKGTAQPCGGGYVMSASALRAGSKFSKARPVPVPTWQTFDIDTEADWNSAIKFWEEMQLQRPAWMVMHEDRDAG